MCEVDIKSINNTKQYVYLYTNKDHTNCIGCMGINFGEEGLEFLHSWKTLNPEIKSKEFSKDLKFVVNELRKCLLRNRFYMAAYIEHNETMKWQENGKTMAAYIVERKGYKYYIRCNPSPAANSYIYCYTK